jgi:glycosyltransferase involved in cell wall biosynthesis
LKTAAYIPLFGKIVNEKAAAALKDADRVIVYTDFARAEFVNAFGRLGAGFPTVDVIPHGIDRDRFFPLPGLREAGSFMVLNASRPDRRKRLDLTIAGFARFACDKPGNVKLCLHHAFFGQREQEQIHSWIREFGVEDRVSVNPLGSGVRDDRELNLLYNACAVGINTSMGEGWGLVSFEHGATGAAQIVPDHTACAELWRGRGELIPVDRSYVPEFSVLEMGEVSVEGVAGALENLYCDADRRRWLGEEAYRAAMNPEYSWDGIAHRVETVFGEIVG